MEGTGNKRWLTPAILTLFVTSIALGSLEFSVVGMQEELHNYYDKSIADIGLLVTVFAVGVVIGTPIIMMVTGKLNRFRLMAISMILLIVATAVPLMIKSYELMLASRFIEAILCGAIVSSSYFLSTDLPPPEHKAKAMTLVFAGYSVSSVFIIPIVETIAFHSDIKVAYNFIIGLQAVSLAMILLFVPRRSSVWVGNRKDEIGLFRDRRIILALIMPMFAVGAVYMVYSYISDVFVTGFGVPQNNLYVLLFMFGIMCIISNVISAYTESHGGLRNMKYVFAVQAALLVLISVAMCIVDNQNWPFGLTVTLLLGVVMYIINTPLQSYYIRVAKRDYPGGVYLSACFQSIAFNLGVALGSLMGGAMVHNGQMFNLGYAAAIVTAIAIALIVVLERMSRPGDLTEC